MQKLQSRLPFVLPNTRKGNQQCLATLSFQPAKHALAYTN